MAGNRSTQPLAGRFAHLGGFRKLHPGLRRCRQNGAGERMFRVALQTRHERQHLRLGEAGGDQLFGQLRLAVGERPGLVEDRGATLGDLLEHDGTLDDDRPAGAQGNRADDGDRDGDQQRAGRGDDQHREEANGVSRHGPREHGDRQRDRRVDRAQAIPEPAQRRPAGLGLAHDFHDLRVARIGGALGGANRQGRLAVDRARDHRRATGLGDLERLARQVGFVHHAMAVDHHAVHRADIVRIDHERVADGHVLQRRRPRSQRPVSGGPPKASAWPARPAPRRRCVTRSSPALPLRRASTR